MSKYTTELRFICEQLAGYSESVGCVNIVDVIQKARCKIFESYPIFDENYRETLETKILLHYYFREIGFETIGLFKYYLQLRMNEIMPYYNQLYETLKMEFNPFNDVDVTKSNSGSKNETSNKTDETSETSDSTVKSTDVTTNNSVTVDSTSTSTTGSENISSNTSGKNLYSDTPQGGLSGVESMTYLTNATITSDGGTSKQDSSGSSSCSGREETNETRNITSNASSSGSHNHNGSERTTRNGSESFEEKISGKQGTQSYSSLLKEYRETFLNVDMLVIKELDDLFMSLW